MICDYCTEQATYITREGGDVLCRACLHDQYDDPSDAAARLTAATLRMYGAQVTREVPQ